jgi:hypothetical protein
MRTVISRPEMMFLMLRACPSFEGKWNEFLEYWKESPEPPLYLVLSDLARHLTAKLARGDISSFPAVFAVVERWLVEGDPYVKEAAAIGFLEGLQNKALHKGTEPAQFRPYLLPESAKWWDRLDGFWERSEILRGD